MFTKEELKLLYDFATNLSGGYWEGTEAHIDLIKKLMSELNLEDSEVIEYFRTTHMPLKKETPRSRR